MRNVNALVSISNKICTPCKKAVFDIETIGWTQPYACGFYDGKNMLVFDGKNCIKDFLENLLVHRYRGYCVYAHNAGKFDFNFVLQEICKSYLNKGFIIKPIRVGSRIIQIQIIKNRDSWILRDSIAMLPFTLKELTTNFNVEDKKGEFDHEKINWRNYINLKDEWMPYLVNDCKGLYQVITTFEDFFIKRFNVSLRKDITIAQLAMHNFRKNYLINPIPTYESREEDIRKAYYGGRTEIFKVYGENLHYYDVNSLYPYVMKKYPMPVGVPMKSFEMDIDDFGVAYCEIETPENIYIPVLPYRLKTKLGYKLIFPRGIFNGWYCTPELKIAEEAGYKIKIIYGYKFNQEYLFSNYIDDLYDLKKKSKKGSVDFIVSKLLMNSLYGKFGQRREKDQVIMFPKSLIGLEPVDFFGELPIYVKKVKSQSKHILPAIAAFVTAYARIELYKLLRDNDPLYCDTDSLITTKELSTGEDLGMLKDEMPEGITEAIMILPKAYAIRTPAKDYIKFKGFPRGLFSFEDLKNVYETKDYSKLEYSKEKLGTAFESMRRNKTFVSMINVTRRVVTKYDKRKITDGINTIPINISDDLTIN